jgi:RNA polymerase primary sigma factor
MSTEQASAIHQLVELAEEQGHLTQADIVQVIPDAATDADVMERITASLQAEGVEIEDEAEEAEDDPTDVGVDYVSSAEANMVTDSVRLYLREIARAPLLTAQEEIELAKRVEQGDDEAVQRLIRSNLRLVVHIAKRYLNRGLPLLDLIQEGNFGLMRAIQKYDWRRASASRRTPPGGSGRPSPGPSRTRRAPSACPSTSRTASES